MQDLSQLLQQFSDVFQLLPGWTTVIDHHTETGEALPVRQVPYRVPREQVDRELKDMLEHGFIEHSSSDWASPIVVVPKKDKRVCLCVDYRKLNAVSKSDAYPMPQIDGLIDRVGNANYITTLDLTKGYWQVPVAVMDQPKTAFTAPQGLFQFRRMPFGLKGVPATFQRMIDKILGGLGDLLTMLLYSAPPGLTT